MPLIECKDLFMNYEGVCAVHDVSFSLNEGEFLSIIGENGSGKSTLVKGILGLKQYNNGTIDFNGLKQTEIGYLPQQTEAQKDFPATVSEVIMSGFLGKKKLFPFYTKKDRIKAHKIIDRLGITSIMSKSYRELSGGQQQRTLLARAFCATDKLLLLDEPSTGLDRMITTELYSIISDLNKNNGVSMIMVTHDIEGALLLSDKILHISSDQSFFGSKDEYLRSELYSKISGNAIN